MIYSVNRKTTNCNKVGNNLSLLETKLRRGWGVQCSVKMHQESLMAIKNPKSNIVRKKLARSAIIFDTLDQKAKWRKGSVTQSSFAYFHSIYYIYSFIVINAKKSVTFAGVKTVNAVDRC